MSRCKACGEEIAFVQTAKGRWIPVEGAEPETYYVHHNQPGHPQIALVLDSGEILRGRGGTQYESGVLKVEARESHFARCPAAAEFRREEGKRRPTP